MVLKRDWRWNVGKEDGTLVLIKEKWDRISGEWIEEEIIRDVEKIREAILTCPKCGQSAQGWFVRNMYEDIAYIYLWHWKSGEKRKHMWFLAKYAPEWDELLSKLLKRSIEMTEELRQAIDLVLIKRKGYTKEQKKLAKEFLKTILSARKIVVM